MIRNGFPALDFPALEPLASLYFLPVISLFIFVRIFTFAVISYVTEYILNSDLLFSKLLHL